MVILNVNQRQIKQSFDFANEIIRKQNQFNRFSKTEEIQIVRTHVGKLAELLFYQYLIDNQISVELGDMFEIFEGAENVDTFDFVLPNGKTIDIKTASLPFHKRIMIPISQFHLKKDFYVGIKLNFKTNSYGQIQPEEIERAVIYGYATRQMMENEPTLNFGEGNCKSYLLASLLPIEDLIKMFHQ
jgi:hypothetical protein